MAIVGSASQTWSSEITLDDGSEQITEGYRVVSDTMNENPRVVRAAPGLPARGSTYGGGSFLSGDPICSSIRATKNEENPKWWDVQVVYRTAGDFTTSSPPAENPLDRPTVYSSGISSFTFDAVDDEDDEAITNSAGEPFNPPPQVLGLQGSFTATKYFDRDRLLDFYTLCGPRKAAPVNSAPFHGFPAGKVILVDWKSDPVVENGYQVWKEVFQFAVADQWFFNILNAGYYEIVSGERVLIRDKEGQPVSAPVLLDAAGAKLDPGDTPIYRQYYIHREFNFSAFGLE